MFKRFTTKPYFKFNGVRSDDMGVLLVNMPVRQHPFLNGTKKTIAGHDGFMYISDGSYSPITVKIDIVVPKNSDLPAVLNWLRGSGDVSFFDYPDRCYPSAIINSAVQKASVTKRSEGTKMTVTWTCQPFMKDSNYSTSKAVITSSGTNIAPHGHVDSSPLVAISGAFTDGVDVTIGNTTMTVALLTNEPLYIDCEAKVAYTLDSNDNPVFAGSKIKLKTGDWYSLSASVNTTVSFSSPVASVTVFPNWRWF